MIQAFQQSQLPQDRRDPRQWPEEPLGAEAPQYESVEVREVNGERFWFKPNAAAQKQPSLPKLRDTVSRFPESGGIPVRRIEAAQFTVNRQKMTHCHTIP